MDGEDEARWHLRGWLMVLVDDGDGAWSDCVVEERERAR